MTLVELLVTLAILGIVLAAITGAFISGTKAETGVEVRQQAQSDARVALSRMRDDIHCAFDVQSLATNPSGGYTLSLTEFYNQCASVGVTPAPARPSISRGAPFRTRRTPARSTSIG